MVSFKNSFKYCEKLGCTQSNNIQWCCPELMPLCNPKTELLNSIDSNLIELSYSNNKQDIELIENKIKRKLEVVK